MKNNFLSPFLLISLFFFSGIFSDVWAITPMAYYNGLVAGSETAGFADGKFIRARFSSPCGLSFNDSGDQLYVADPGNHRIRVIYLNQNNTVKTLAGQSSAGQIDGPVSIATFSLPQKIVFVPGKGLAVFDAGVQSLRLINLHSETVTTLAKGVNVGDVVYRKEDDSLYFSEPAQQKIEKMNMKSLVVTGVLAKDPRVPSPGAICLYKDQLMVADSTLPGVFSVALNQKKVPAAAVPYGAATDVLALCRCGDDLYAIQRGGFLLKISPSNSRVIRFPTPWGFLFKDHDHDLYSFLGNDPRGITVSPKEPFRFFISTGNWIVSVKDYDFEAFWSTGSVNGDLTDFSYPATKPLGTFRILIIGSSTGNTSVPIPTDVNIRVSEGDDPDLNVDLFAKRLEFHLNTEVSLNDLSIHFEVLNLSHRGKAIDSFAYDEVPAVVKKYDIDLVLGLTAGSGYADYYERPMTSEGVPSRTLDPEYMLKPLSQRTPPGAAADLVERCRELGLIKSDKQMAPGDGLWSLFCKGDDRINHDLEELTSQRFLLLDQKLKDMKTSGGTHPQLVLFYVPCIMWAPCAESFYEDMCSNYHLKFFDLTDGYNALKLSYFPTNVNHYTAYGNELIAVLLQNYLIHNKMIPFSQETPPKND